MGLCPDCQNEGETVTFVGSSKAEVSNSGENSEEDDCPDNSAEDNEQNTRICDLCGIEYEVTEG